MATAKLNDTATKNGLDNTIKEKASKLSLLLSQNKIDYSIRGRHFIGSQQVNKAQSLPR